MSAYDIDAPLYGVAGEPIEGEILEQLLKRQVSQIASARKLRAAVAYDVYAGNLEHLILQAINHQQSSETIKRDMRRFVSSVRDDARDVTELVAVGYKNGAARHLGEDGDESDTDVTAQEEALRLLALECAIDEIGEQVNHLAWLQGPQFVVPLVRDGRLCADVIGPHVYDIVQNVADPLGHPVGLAWKVGEREVDQGGREVLVHVLDAVSLRLFRVRVNGRTAGVEPESFTEHNHGRLPAACLRFTRPIAGDDWYLVDRQRRLTQGTIEVGVLMARLGLVRKAQCHKLLTMVGDLESVSKGQSKGDPEAVLTANTGGRQGRQVEFEALDYDTDPSNFIRHVLFIVQSMIEPYGGHVQVDSGQPDIFGKIVIPPDVQAEHRKRQLKPLAAFERQFWSFAASMLRAERHKLALDLPPAEEIEKRLRVNFGELTRELEDPEKAITFEDWKLSRGQTSEVQLMRRQLGGASTEEAWREIERRMDERKRFNELAARYNLPTSNMGSVQTTPEANGAMGTPAREENRAAMAAQEGGGAGGRQPAPAST